MPAWARPLVEQCASEHCDKQATHEVRNERNEPIRRCCKKHAELLVKWLNKEAPQ